MAEFGVSLRPELTEHIVYGTRVEGYKSMERILARNVDFTAVICHNDNCALGVEERLLIAGKRIPEDVSVIGFDNLKECADYPVPLTICAGDLEEIIQEVIAYLFSGCPSGQAAIHGSGADQRSPSGRQRQFHLSFQISNPPSPPNRSQERKP